MTGGESLVWAVNIGEQLLKNGAEISRVEDTVGRICVAYGARQQHVFCVASCLIVTILDKDGNWQTQTRRIREFQTDMDKLDKINNLSRQICSHQLTPEETEARFEEIIRGPSYGIGARCLIWALIASSFTLFFGGNLWDAAAAAVVGGILHLATFGLNSIHINRVFANIMSSFFCGGLGALPGHLCADRERLSGVFPRGRVRHLLRGNLGPDSEDAGDYGADSHGGAADSRRHALLRHGSSASPQIRGFRPQRIQRPGAGGVAGGGDHGGDLPLQSHLQTHPQMRAEMRAIVLPEIQGIWYDSKMAASQKAERKNVE